MGKDILHDLRKRADAEDAAEEKSLDEVTSRSAQRRRVMLLIKQIDDCMKSWNTASDLRALVAAMAQCTKMIVELDPTPEARGTQRDFSRLAPSEKETLLELLKRTEPDEDDAANVSDYSRLTIDEVRTLKALHVKARHKS